MVLGPVLVGVRVLVVGVLGVLGVAVLVLVVFHDDVALVVTLPVRVGVGALGVGVLVLGVLLLTPGGLVGFLLAPLWIIAVSVIAYRRTSRFVASTERDTVLAPNRADR